MFFAPLASSYRTRLSRVPSTRALDQGLERFLQQTLSRQEDGAAIDSKNVNQDDKSYQLQLDLPGISREQLSIKIEANEVRIESKAEAARAYQFAYRFPLEIDSAGSEAKLENGVLTLKLGKLLPQSKAISLEVA